MLEKKNDPGEPGVRLGTMHRVKGLEFPVMLLAGVNSGVVPMRVASVEGDLTARAGVLRVGSAKLGRRHEGPEARLHRFNAAFA